MLTVLTFSLYDTVIVFDKVKENTEGVLDSRRSTYAEEANLAVNETLMRSISTSVISALPIIALMIVAVWLLGVGTLQDLAMIQLIGVVEGVISSLFLATSLLVTLTNMQKPYKKHNQEVADFRAGVSSEDEASVSKTAKRTVSVPSGAADVEASDEGSGAESSATTTWRPTRG